MKPILTPSIQINITNVQRTIEHQKAFSVYQKKDGEIITTYSSLSDASKITGISKGNISSCISGRLLTINGFTWEVVNKEVKNNQRTCLMCGKLFDSSGAGNRRCKKCDKNSQGVDYYKVSGIINYDFDDERW